MSSFTDELWVSPLPDGRHWKLVRAFNYYFMDDIPESTIKIPVGFITDFASSPFFTWSFIPPWGRYGKAAILHDYLYQHSGYLLISDTGWLPVTRKEADDIFLEAMTVLNVARWRRFLMYWGVRAFGWLAWK